MKNDRARSKFAPPLTDVIDTWATEGETMLKNNGYLSIDN
jgi:hypothetical protein